jgi:hypothetical protein
MGWSQLPESILINVVRIVGQSCTHGRHSLALVCSSWAAAIAADDALVKNLDVYR